MLGVLRFSKGHASPGDEKKNRLLKKTNTTLDPQSWRTSFIGEVRAESKSCVRTSSGRTDWFQVTSRVNEQARLCAASPALHYLHGQVQKEANPDLEALNEWLFSDDQSLSNEDEKAIQA